MQLTLPLEMLTQDGTREYQGKRTALGKHIYGRGEEYLREHANEGDNREHCLLFLKETNKINANSFFEKTQQNKITYKETWTHTKAPPFIPTQFAEIDF
jgi:hypothetical protein